MTEPITFYNPQGQHFGKDSKGWKWVKENVHQGNHIHVQGRAETLCWNGDCVSRKVDRTKRGMAL